MKGNNEGEEGGISIASRKTRAVGHGSTSVASAQDGAVSVDQERESWAPLFSVVMALVICHWRADEMKQALALAWEDWAAARNVRVDVGECAED
jgi:hypothetical protein